MKIGTPILNWGFSKIQGSQPKEPRLQCVDAKLRREVADFPMDPLDPPGNPKKSRAWEGKEQLTVTFRGLFTWCLYKAFTLLPKWVWLKTI